MVQHQPLQETLFIQKQTADGKIECPTALIRRQHAWLVLPTQTAVPVLWKADRTTLTPLVD
jgi:hypothetical protein